MSRQFHPLRLLGQAGLVAAATLALATNAAAATTTVNATCKFPLIGAQTVPITLTTPASVVRDVGESPGSISVRLPDGFAPAATRVTPVFHSFVHATYAQGPAAQPAGTSLWGDAPTVAGETEGLFFSEIGPATITVDELRLRLRGFDATGTPLVIAQAPTDLDGKPLGSTDDDPTTFDVPCRIDPLAPVATFQVVAPTDSERPTPPGPFTVGAVADTFVDLSWGASTDNIGVVKYLIVSEAGEREVVAPATSTRVGGLTPDTAYTMIIRAVDAGGNHSEAVEVAVRTKPAIASTTRFRYDLAGTAAIKTLTRGSVKLKGGMLAAFNVATGSFSADLSFERASARLTSLGFLPVTAKLDVVPSGKATGRLSGDVLTASAKVRIKVQEVKLFGAIPLAGGNSCQTRELTDLALTSAPGWSPQAGGTLTSKFAISDLNGCGTLNGLVSSATAGANNDLTLTSIFKQIETF